MMTTCPNLLSANQAAEQLGISHRTLLRRIARGEVTAEKLGSGLTSAYVITTDEVARVKGEPHAREH